MFISRGIKYKYYWPPFVCTLTIDSLSLDITIKNPAFAVLLSFENVIFHIPECAFLSSSARTLLLTVFQEVTLSSLFKWKEGNCTGSVADDFSAHL